MTTPRPPPSTLQPVTEATVATTETTAHDMTTPGDRRRPDTGTPDTGTGDCSDGSGRRDRRLRVRPGRGHDRRRRHRDVDQHRQPGPHRDELGELRHRLDRCRRDGASVTFDEPGTFTYICSFHPFMTGHHHRRLTSPAESTEETPMHLTSRQLNSLAQDVDDLHNEGMKSFAEETADLHLDASRAARRRFARRHRARRRRRARRPTPAAARSELAGRGARPRRPDDRRLRTERRARRRRRLRCCRTGADVRRRCPSPSCSSATTRPTPTRSVRSPATRPQPDPTPRSSPP